MAHPVVPRLAAGVARNGSYRGQERKGTPSSFGLADCRKHPLTGPSATRMSGSGTGIRIPISTSIIEREPAVDGSHSHSMSPTRRVEAHDFVTFGLAALR